MGDDNYWEAPRDALQSLVPSVPLTEKYLKRPPFKYVHDIVMSLHKDFNLFAGSELTEAEFDPKNIEGKEGKVAFLTKIIKHTEQGLGKRIDVNPKKIASGSECEKTAAFLCDLAQFASSRQGTRSGGAPPSSAAAGGEVASSPPPPPPPPPQETKTNEQAAAAAAPPPPPPPSQETTEPAAAAAPPPPPPPPPPAEGGTPPPPPPPPVDPNVKGPSLNLDVGQDALGGVDPKEKQEIMKEAGDFKQALESKGLGLDESQDPAKVQKIAADIRQMELELKSHEVPPTDPSTMSAEQLEKAFSRQHEMVHQIDALALQNHALMERIMRAAAP